MSSYVDVETSAEGIQEEEELIEAVEALVNHSIVSVKREIVNDLKDMRQQVQERLDWMFPVLVEYRNDTRSFTDDVNKGAFTLLLLAIAFFILAPSHKKQKKRQWFKRNRSESWSAYSHNNSPGNSGSVGGSTSGDSDSRLVIEEETDEERFEKMWSSISMSRYRKLVLPPTCRRVENVSSSIKATAKETRKDEETVNDEENPARRLQTYFTLFLYLARSIMSYDYVGAGWTLLLWLQGIRRHRTTNQKQSTDASSDDRSSPLPSPTRSEEHQEPVQSRSSLILSPVEEKKEVLLAEEKSPPILPATLEETPSAMNLERMTSEATAYFESGDSRSNDSQKAVTPLHKTFALKPRDAKGPSDSREDENATFLSPAAESTTLSTDPALPAVGSDPGEPVEQSAIVMPPELSSEESSIRKRLKESSDDGRGAGYYFFETAHSHDSLKKLSIEVPVPDKNGYILGDEFLPDSSRYTPLLVFVNSRAGPQQGHLLITQLRRLLNPIQVWDLATGGPETVLESFLVLSRLRILVCGGDGTVSWIVSALERMEIPKNRKRPPIAILPLGTGNDLARIHGWGGGYNNESLITILEQISESYISLLDRWEVTIDGKQPKKKEVKTFFNYLGVGADAQAALQVHYLRESRPAWFFSRMVNKAWYGIFGAEDIIMASSVNVRKEIKLFADGVEVSLPSDSQGIILLNIDSYAGGVPLWSHGTKPGLSSLAETLKSPRRSQSMNMLGRRSNSIDRVDSLDDIQTLLSDEDRLDRVTACDRPSSCQDGVLDVVSIRGAFHLGQIKVGLSNAQRICQCREAKIVIKNKVAVQIDGEPWRQRPCTLTVKRKPEPAVMLHRSADDGGVETEMSKLLDWAEERRYIDSEVHSVLMKEYSRRIESKTRRRRVREQDNIMHTLKKAISQSHVQGSHNWQGGIAF